MRYESFYVKNFKGIQELAITLDNIPNSEIITLVGINESGKSTVLDALELFAVPKSLEKAYEFIPKSKQFNFTDEVLIQANLILDKADMGKISDALSSLGLIPIEIGDKLVAEKRYIFKDSNAIEYKTSFKIVCKYKTSNRSKTVYNINLNSEQFSSIKKHLEDALPQIVCYRNFLFDFPDKIYLEEGAESTSKKNIVYKTVLQDILDCIAVENKAGNLNIADHIVAKIKSTKPADEEALNQILTLIGEKITHTVFTAWDKIFTSSNKQILIKHGIDQNTQESYVEMRLKQGSQNYKMSERSLGFRWFFTFLLFTEFRKNRIGDPGQTLFLLDEPASNLHSTAQSKLLGTFDTLTDGNCRLVYTTHSHHLINPKWLAGTFIVINNALNLDPNNPDFDAKNTKISVELYKRYVSKASKEQSYFQPILDALEYQPSKLEDVPNIVIVEGKNDYHTFKYINEVILKEKHDINFYPGAGADKDEVIIRCYQAWNRDYTILRDSDAGGKKANERYIKLLGDTIKDKVFDFADANPSFDKIATEDIFNKTEQLEIIKTLFPTETTYSKSKFNSAIQQLFIDQTIIELSEETIAKFEIIFDFLEAK